MERRTFLKVMGGLAGGVLSRHALALPVPQERAAKLAVVGLGGAGGRIVSKLASATPEWWRDSNLIVEHYAIDTDRRSLDYVSGDVRRILLPEFPHGSSGSCIDPSFARQVAWRHRHLFKDIWNARNLPHDPIVILVGGFGRGAGTGLSQFLCWQAVQQPHWVNCFPMLSMPFSWEMHAVSLPKEMRRLERAAFCGVCEFNLDESNLDRPVDAAFDKVDEEIAEQIRMVRMIHS